MKIRIVSIAAWACLSACSGLFAADTLPPVAARTVDFQKDIVPILSGSCLKCHSGHEPKGGLRIETRETLLAGGDSGKVVVPQKSGESLLVRLVAGLDADRIMPAQGPRLTAEQIGLLRAWIDQGLPWQEGVRLQGLRQATLAPRRVPLPPAVANSALTNPIDLILQPYFAQHGIEISEPVSDSVFARRVYLDLVGLLPPPDELAAFEKDSRPDKRKRLVRQLLDDRTSYAAHWLTFWNDALRNAYRGTGFIDGGRKPISDWLYRSLYENKPYDRFVHELISPVPGSEGFTGGIIWRGVVNASQRREMQAAQNVSQVFMGTNLKCASCHDSFINHWKLTDAYALAAVFADGPLEIHRCDKPTGQFAEVGFFFPELGSIDGKSPKPRRMQQLADIITRPENGRLSRTIVNRLWAWLLGRGIVEPLDDMDQPAWSDDLLDWLAADLQDHGYDLKHTLELICTSRVYQLPSVGAPRPDETEFMFRGPIVKRMTAEQFVDAVSTLTGVWPQKGAFSPTATTITTQSAAPLAISAKWIWSHPRAASADPGGRVFLRKTFQLSDPPAAAFAVATCDNSFRLFVNGRQVATSDNWQTPVELDLSKTLQPGSNTVAVEAVNFPDAATKKGLEFSGPNPAGFIFALAVQSSDGSWSSVGSDASWVWTSDEAQGWQRPDFDTQGWKHASELGGFETAPWKLGGALNAALARKFGQPAGSTAIRTALVNDDQLTRALGRPNREQVVTRRDTIATTLQALELTNGETLDSFLKRGARNWLSPSPTSPDELIDRLYQKALGRLPNPQEKSAARELLGPAVSAEGIEDLLWVVTMLPEFQLIY
jgi:hypothetical protein